MGISIKVVNVGLPANLLQIRAFTRQGMIPVTNDAKEIITDIDVEMLFGHRGLLDKERMTPDRSIPHLFQREFIDCRPWFPGISRIRDPVA